MDLTTKTPVEIDTELSKLWQEEATLKMRLRTNLHTLAEIESGKNRWYSERNIAFLKESVEAEKAKLAANKEAQAPFIAEFERRGGWKRYFLVTNSNGHVHRGMDCGTCFPTTQYAWLIELADCDEDKMIEEFGEDACTVCFPTAPANPRFHAPGSRKAEAIAARQAEKAEKQAAKDAKAITAPDGSPLRVGGNIVRTKVAAQRELSQSVQDYAYYGPTHPSDFEAEIVTLIAALECAGIDPTPIIERASKKAMADAKKGGFTDRMHTLPNF